MSSQLRLPAALPSVFSQHEWGLVQDVVARLNESQRFWLSGYLAAGQLQGIEIPAEKSAAPRARETPVLIAYGSETGNSKALAAKLQQLASARAITARVVDLATLRPRQLTRENTLLVICSTHGDGDPPEPIVQFHEELARAQPGSLTNLQYAVLALGDSSYDKFCQTGRDIDHHLQRAGASRLQQREDCDVDFLMPAERWMHVLLDKLGSSASAVAAAVSAAMPLSDTTPAHFSKKNPCVARVLDSVCLSHASRQEKYWHIELETAGDLALQPGDAIGLLPRNSPALVEGVLAAANLLGATSVTSGGETKPLSIALRDNCDLVLASKTLLEKWAAWSDSAQLRELIAGDPAQLRHYLKTVQVKDLLQQFPVQPDADDFVQHLRPLQPRLYDVANDPTTNAGEIHLLVKHYHYWFGPRIETGVASDYLCGIAAEQQLHVYPHHHARFRLTDSDSPLILLAEGSGIAPYRAFIESLRAAGNSRPCWVLFAEMQYEQDFLYQIEWQQAVAEGLVTHFEGVFLGDDPTQSLQQRVVAAGTRFMEWMQRGAEVYLCGERKMLTECEETLARYHDEHGAGTRWQELSRQGRIHKNLY